MGGSVPQVVFFVGAGAVILAALIASWSAGRQQKRQLAHDYARHVLQLEHDADRQKRELTNDRVVADRSELRSMLDWYAETLNEFLRAVRDFRSVAPVDPEPGGDLDEHDQRKLMDEAEQRVDALAESARASRYRLEMRLGPNHAVVEKYLLTIDTAKHVPWEMKEALKYEHGNPRRDMRLNDAAEQWRKVIDHRWDFLIAALPLVQSEFAEGKDEPR